MTAATNGILNEWTFLKEVNLKEQSKNQTSENDTSEQRHLEKDQSEKCKSGTGHICNTDIRKRHIGNVIWETMERSEKQA